MPITRGAKKKLRQDKKRHAVNQKIKTQVKKGLKAFRAAPSEKLLPGVFTLLDHARKKNIFHANKTARLKSQFAKLLSKKSKQEPSSSPAAGLKKKNLRKKVSLS